MSIQKSAAFFSRKIRPLMQGIGLVGGVSLLFMMLLVAFDVVLRFFGRPIPGAYEFVEYSMAITISFGITVCAHQEGHIAVDIVTNLLKRRAKQIVASLVTLIAIAYTVPIMWMTALQVGDTYSSGVTSAVLRVAVYPFVAIVAFSFVMTLIVFIADLLNLLAELSERWTQ